MKPHSSSTVGAVWYYIIVMAYPLAADMKIEIAFSSNSKQVPDMYLYGIISGDGGCVCMRERERETKLTRVSAKL